MEQTLFVKNYFNYLTEGKQDADVMLRTGDIIDIDRAANMELAALIDSQVVYFENDESTEATYVPFITVQLAVALMLQDPDGMLNNGECYIGARKNGHIYRITFDEGGYYVKKATSVKLFSTRYEDSDLLPSQNNFWNPQIMTIALEPNEFGFRWGTMIKYYDGTYFIAGEK